MTFRIDSISCGRGLFYCDRAKGHEEVLLGQEWAFSVLRYDGGDPDRYYHVFTDGFGTGLFTWDPYTCLPEPLLDANRFSIPAWTTHPHAKRLLADALTKLGWGLPR